MEFVKYLEHWWFTAAFFGIFGAIFGSFLGALYFRLPHILERNYIRECKDYIKSLNLSFDKKSQQKLKDKSTGFITSSRSFCHNCKKTIKARHNIPIFSYIFLLGKCAYCGEKIHHAHVIIETITCIASIIIGLQFGLTAKGIAILFFTYALIALSSIDIKHRILPDEITISVLWASLIINCFKIMTPIENAVLSAAIGYVSMWIVAHLFLLIRKKQGIGHGDFKMLAMIAAFGGFNLMLNVILIASVSGILLGCINIMLNKTNWDTKIPFGPFLGFAAFVALTTGINLTNSISTISTILF